MLQTMLSWQVVATPHCKGGRHCGCGILSAHPSSLVTQKYSSTCLESCGFLFAQESPSLLGDAQISWEAKWLPASLTFRTSYLRQLYVHCWRDSPAECIEMLNQTYLIQVFWELRRLSFIHTGNRFHTVSPKVTSMELLWNDCEDSLADCISCQIE